MFFHNLFINFIHNIIMGDLSLKNRYKPVAEGAPISESLSLVRGLGQENRHGEFSAQEARGIYIRGYGVTSADDKNPVLGTKGMGPCLAVAIYNPTTKTGTLAHFDTNTDTGSLTKMVDAVRGQGGVLEVHLAGGELGSLHSHRLVEEVVDRLKSESDMVIKSADIMNPTGSLKSLALDTRTGEISNSFMGSQLNPGDRQNIMGYHASRALSKEPLRPEYLNGVAFSVEDWKLEEQLKSPAPPPAMTPAR